MYSQVFRNGLRNKIPSILLGIFALNLVALSHYSKPSLLQVERHLVAPPVQLEKFAFGYQEAIADTLWIRAIQDFDYCESEIANGVCRGNSWLYQMLDAITDLSPHFRIAYAAGGLALTVIISDIEGATKLFDKGVEAFPNDWPILYRAAYHQLYEVKDKERAAELMKAAAENGGPPWLYTLSGRLYSDAGNLQLAEALLQEMIETKQDETLIKRLRDKIASIRSETK